MAVLLAFVVIDTRRQSRKLGAAPHLPAGILSPYSDAERRARPTPPARRWCRRLPRARASAVLPRASSA
ncbi:MAG: hypothetical protein EOS65_06300 [Mesorhizobium sp.]|nr:hypothetical protein EN779_32070 [Mesorhizobium sp. M4B.F.Ca.ET.088.02.2.1]RWA62801.1 MAG: hypothetical protein EOQ27_15045 [Mesorhizobium sp.]RWF30251.1 MAG: hypothetical protein EOS45_15250 [Mesorhizobium sp.]RWF43179.1 MAG: hypothetical protein EOS65_06300 [Mesorhizobium sp.]TIX19090.1 MAG: hypothetical protein E5V41_03255 [Mesorhizobium sp.]